MARAKRPTLAQYERVLELRRARVPAQVICEIVGLTSDAVTGLISDGLPAKKGVHPAKRPIRAVLIEEQAGLVTQALDWASSLATAARSTAVERAITAHTAAKIERLLVSAWSRTIDNELRAAKTENREVSLDALMPGREVLVALRTLAKTRDLAPDVRAPIEVYRKRLDESTEGGDDESIPPIDPTLYGDLLELDDAGLEHFATTGKFPVAEPKQLELPAAKDE